MFNVGDVVKFKNEKGEGIVSRVDNKYVFVTIEDGFEIPFLPEQLIIVKPVKNEENIKEKNNDFSLENEKNDFKQEKVGDLSDNIYLAFTIVENTDVTVEKVALHLVNDTSDYINYCLFWIKDSKFILVDSEVLEPATKISITDLDKTDYVRIEKIFLQVIRYNTDKKGIFLESDFVVSSSALINLNSYISNEFFNERALLFPLIKGEDKETKEELNNKMESDLASHKIKKNNMLYSKDDKRKKGIVEYDLHIETLRSDFTTLTPSQILNIQLAYFRQKLEECIEDKNVKKVIFIHGVGNGTLKLEICRILQKEYAHYDYQDASYAEYGYGATMVILRK